MPKSSSWTFFKTPESSSWTLKEAFQELCRLSEDDPRTAEVLFQFNEFRVNDKCDIFTSTACTPQEARKALQLLALELQQDHTAWPTLDLIRCHSKLSRLLREANPVRDSSDSLDLVTETALRIKQTYTSLGDFIPDKSHAALRPTSPEAFISHSYLRTFVAEFSLPIDHQGERKPVVSIAIPNGPLLAAVCLAVTAHYTAAPINPAAGAEQFQADVLQAGAKCILATRGDFEKLQLGDKWAKENQITVLLADLDDDMTISIKTPEGMPVPASEPAPPNCADDIALILFTSGTSGTKKVVPITTHSIVAGVAFVLESWALTDEDVCLNMMPLYHVGGLIRNIFAPIFSGGCTICCPGFDPSTFWDMTETSLPTWYYASPSMHSLILAEATNRQDALQKNRIRLVCNAAGGLLPSLAIQLRDTFDAVVLPSYGMTECMPISTPPVDYKLDRPGTSGVSTGPELAIFDCAFQSVPSRTVGRVCVRGEPLFLGYLQPDGGIDRSPFNEDGWFDTGDMGYMDEEGYLYITGRSKEVINRGGELISPFEVENAIVAASMREDSPLHGRVTQALAFSVSHDVLQEVVGVVIVTPKEIPRPDLRLLHSSLKSSLQQAKWPSLVVYMDDLPKRNNKVLRIRLADRLSLPQLTDDTPYLERHYEGVCPQPDTELSVAIDSSVCRINLDDVWREISCVLPDNSSFCIRLSSRDTIMRVILAPHSQKSPPLQPRLQEFLKAELLRSMHGYMIPQKMQTLQKPLPFDASGKVDDALLVQYMAEVDAMAEGDLESTVEGRVTKAFASVLGLGVPEISPDADFFDLGGDSLKAGRLLSALRTDFSLHIPIDAIFRKGSVQLLSAYIRERMPNENSRGQAEEDMAASPEGCQKTYDSTRKWLMALQLLPLAVFYPTRRAYQWTVFMVFISFTQKWFTASSVPGRLFNLTLSILVSRLMTNSVAPWVGIAAKWIIIGRYREGMYPMWGPYHTRWWLVQKVVDICGLGLFGQSNFTVVLYCRLMGAKIGKNVTISHVQMGEWDLIEIGDGAVLEECIVRPFAGERNTTMYLGRISIGRNASVGLSSIVAPGTTVPNDTCIGPNSSSWELQGADERNRDLLATNIPGPHWALTLFVTRPLAFLGWIVSLLPWFAGLLGLVLYEPGDTRTPLYSILQWFAASHRVAYHFLALILRAGVSPFLLFFFAVLIKKIMDAVFGVMKPSAAKGRGHVEKWRMSLMKAVFPSPRLHEMTELMGQHYEGTSIAVRMLGGRVGKRVYWPGTGPSIDDYHLLDIGNDVVFGSRAHLVTSDGLGSEKITVEDKAMIADRVTVLPGVTIGEGTIMGSGAVTRRNKVYPDGGTYVGSKSGDAMCLGTGSVTHKAGDAAAETQRVCEVDQKDIEAIREQPGPNKLEKSKKTTDEPDLRVEDASPFGRAFYFKQAPYRVYGLGIIIAYSTCITVLTAFYWNVPSISAIQLVARLFREHHDVLGQDRWCDTPVLFLMFLGFIAVLNTAETVVAVALVVGAKWALLGRRRPGNHDWDRSPYCQRWQLYLAVERLRRQCFRGQGVLGMLTGTHWLVLYFRALGAEVGDQCALFANGRPSLMFTEPDLVRIGDRTVVDDASVVAHVNSRGRFDLNRLEIGARCVLRTGSRLLSGAAMRDDSALLEHTLVMGGDVVEAGWTMQGWPAERYRGRRILLEDAELASVGSDESDCSRGVMREGGEGEVYELEVVDKKAVSHPDLPATGGLG